MLANKFIIVDYLHKPRPTVRATHLDNSNKKTASTCHIMAWQTTIYQHQLKRNYKLPKIKLEIKTCSEYEILRLKNAHTKKKGQSKECYDTMTRRLNPKLLKRIIYFRERKLKIWQ